MAKYELTYAQMVWDNYNPYVQPKEYNDKELLTHDQEKYLKRLQKAYTRLAELAGYEPNKGLITSISKKALRNV
jgi:hypothetical protein